MSGRPPAPQADRGWNTPTVVAAVVLLIVWGSSSVATRIGLDSYGPGQLALLRFLMTTVIMTVFLLVRRLGLPEKRDVIGLILLGIIGISVVQITFVYGLQTVDPGTATFLLATVPVITAVLAWFILGERLTGIGWVGILLTVVGTTVLVLGQGGGIGYTSGALILLVGALSESFYYILMKRYLVRYTPTQVGTWTLIASTLPLLIFLPGLPAQVQAAAPTDTLAVVYVAVGAGALGYVAVGMVNSRLSATTAAVLLAGMPPVALFFSWLILGVVPTVLSVLGGLVSLVGVVIVTTRGRGRG